MSTPITCDRCGKAEACTHLCRQCDYDFEAVASERDDLLAACKEALQFVARHTPLVDSDVPIVGEIADQFDAMAMQLRAAIARAEGGAA